MTLLPTTVGEMKTQPWVSNRQSASGGFAVPSPVCADTAQAMRIVARRMTNRVRMDEPPGFNLLIVFAFRHHGSSAE
jgi:hypothetical protein